MKQKMIKLEVKDHPGAMSHISGLFARRGFNMDGILCIQKKGTDLSEMRILISEEKRLEQLMNQLNNLHDVMNIKLEDPALEKDLKIFYQ